MDMFATIILTFIMHFKFIDTKCKSYDIIIMMLLTCHSDLMYCTS